MRCSIGSTGCRCRPSRSSTAIASAAGSKSRWPATIRIAIDDASFGFPEVLLGLHPGLGGTVRLPRLINPVQAMTMMLTGKTERARRARSLGSGRRGHAGAPCARRRERRRSAGEMNTDQAGLCSARLMNIEPARGFLASRMRGEAAKKAPQRALSGPLRADRSVGRTRRRCRRRCRRRRFPRSPSSSSPTPRKIWSACFICARI